MKSGPRRDAQREAHLNQQDHFVKTFLEIPLGYKHCISPILGYDGPAMSAPKKSSPAGADLFAQPLFADLLRGTLISRPNRFVVRCAVDGKIRDAYLPNPGRLWELFLPGCALFLVKQPPGGSGALTHMAVAVEREGSPILLHTHRANAIAAALIRAGKIPGLKGAAIIRAEVPMGRSRFDFLLERNGRPFYLEVKSCTLVGRRIAMFPDAVTARGKKHLEELAALGRRGTACGVLFLIHWPQARFFLPDYHTDLAFARTFLEAKRDVSIMAVALTWRSDLSLSSEVRETAIPWEIIAREARDSGSYMILLHIPQEVRECVGSLGAIHFPPGHYLYVGSAKRSLTKRMERHLKKGTSLHWHIDYLKGHADRRLALPVRSSASLEHELAEAMGKIADGAVPSFGSSDCDCPGHLFRFAENPLHCQAFIDLLQHFRIDRLEKMI